LPFRGRGDSILHRVGGIWVAEGKRRGQKIVWVSQLSWFSTISSKAASALCLTWNIRKFLECLALKGISHVNGKLAHWIAEQISSSCVAALAAAGIFGAVSVALTVFTDPACTG